MVKAGRQGRRQKEGATALRSRSGRPAAAALNEPVQRKRKAEAAAVPESPTSASAARGRGRHSRRGAEAAHGARDGGGDSGAEPPTADEGPAGELETAILAILGRRKRASSIEGGRPVWMEVVVRLCSHAPQHHWPIYSVHATPTHLTICVAISASHGGDAAGSRLLLPASYIDIQKVHAKPALYFIRAGGALSAPSQAGRKGACLARTAADHAEGRGPRSITAHQGANSPASASVNPVRQSLQLDFVIL
eukprot:SM000178S03449  [mRNA]  locus=s178:27896:28940:- [translate_table: standard]